LIFHHLSIRYKIGIPLLILSLLALVVLLVNLLAFYFSLPVYLLTASILVIMILLIGLSWVVFVSQLYYPINQLEKAISLVSKGDTSIDINITSKNELGKIAEDAQKVAKNLQVAQEFSQKIGDGKYELNGLGSHLLQQKGLFGSLVSMGNRLKEIAEEDEKRNWVTHGLASFSEVLRSNDTNLQSLCQKILVGIARYLEAQHGGLFVLNEEDTSKRYLELMATYAYQESQYIQNRVLVEENFAEGLIGQAYLEQAPIYLKNVLVENIEIASGLGQSEAQSILIMPLQLNGKVEGILEIASIRPFYDYEREFIEKIAENVASAILSIKVNESTKKLLNASQELTQKLQTQEEELRQNYDELQSSQNEIASQNQLIADQKTKIEKALQEQTEKSEMLEAQEEEMRQNMDMLVATQEQMMLTQIELDGQLNAINNSAISKVEFGIDTNIITANKSFYELMGYDSKEIKGKSHSIFSDKTFLESDEYELFWDKLRNGIAQTRDFEFKNKNQESVWMSTIYSPVLNDKGNIQKIIMLAFDISEAKKLLQETQSQAEILKAQETELRQSMLDLQSTQLELNRKSEAIIQLKEEEAQNARVRAREIENKNQLITSSIQYAQNIQSAILPFEMNILQHVQDFFVVFLPKDIVSGDFYWFSHIQGKSFFAAVDCTGHGVPGAFMSIIGNTLLNEIVNVQQIFDTGKILENLHMGIRTKLRQAESTNQDGMDIALCMIEPSTKDKDQYHVAFSGAKRPLYYIDENGELIEVKGDRKSIGGWQQEIHRTFETNHLTLKKGNSIYLTSDGLPDNPNYKRKKFGVKRFKEIISENYDKSMEVQKEVFLKAIKTHQQGSEQRDDITVMGIKI
jgi:PAS domain S-box-containing protein